MELTHLTDRALLKVGGDDAEHFLDNLVTCNIVNLEADQASFGALLTPQGKILFDFFVVKTADGYLLDTPSSLADDLLKRLTFYRLRAKVDLKLMSDVNAYASSSKTLDGAMYSVSDPRHSGLGYRHYTAEQMTSIAEDYNASRIALGIPAGGADFNFGDAYPHETLMDQFGGVDFKKGCYVGQEVVSRMQHRGTAKKRVIVVTADTALPDFGTEITADGKPAGAMGSSDGNTGLALLRLDRVAKAQSLMAGDVSITAKIQDWVSFGLPESN